MLDPRNLKNKSGNEIVSEQTIKVAKEEVIHVYLEYLTQQRKCFFDTITGANRGESFVSVIEEDSFFEAEYVDGILRYLIGQQNHLSNVVGIFPTYNENVLLAIARDIVVRKILVAPQFQHLVKNPTPLKKASEITDAKELRERNKELEKRNAQDREVNQEAEKILQANGFHIDLLLSLHLECIALSDRAYLGNVQENNILFGDCEQYIIPFLKDDHYTVATAYRTKEQDGTHIHIRFYNSSGGGLNKSYIQQLADSFYQMGFTSVRYLTLSKHEQKDSYNCGIFASFKAVDIVNKQAGCGDRLLEDLSNYNELFGYFRYRVAEMLFDSGCNVSLSPDFFEKLIKEQKRRDAIQSEGASEQSGLFFSLTSMLGIKRKRQIFEKKETYEKGYTIAPFLSKDDGNRPLTLIANRYWPKLSFEQYKLEKKSGRDSENPSEKIVPTSSPQYKRRK